MKLKTGSALTLTRKVGPVSLWVWLLALVAGVIFYRRYKANQALTTATTAAATPLDTTGTGTGTPAIGGGGGDPGQPMQPTNQQPVDNTISSGGTGTPVVYDPYSDPYANNTIGPADIVSPAPGDIVGPGPQPTPPMVTRPPSSRGQATTDAAWTAAKKQAATDAAWTAAKTVAAKKKKTISTGKSLGAGVRGGFSFAPAKATPVRSAVAATPNNAVRTVAPAAKQPPAPVRTPAPPPAQVASEHHEPAPKPAAKPVPRPTVTASRMRAT